ncbi:ferrichrome porin FhuA [Citrobacter freundii]|nr:ferrichrome porin FhuA [Citrobacter freundii]EMB4690486.1 ferrichrome porin FhuA [Citrobacter farmeri]
MMTAGLLMVMGQAFADETMVVEATGQNSVAESSYGPSATIAAKSTISATKTNTSIEKLPQSVSVITRQEMDTHQPKSLKDALAYTPGVVVSDRGSSSAFDYVKIRGFASGQNQNNYLDGLKLVSDSWADTVVDPYMLERIEVLRGPTSVLYGMSNPGGIVQMVSKRPSFTPLHEIQFKMGTDNLMQTGFDFGDTLDENGVYAWRLTGLARSNKDQQTLSRQRRFALAPSFSWRPDENTTLTILASLENDPEVGYYGWLPKSGTLNTLPDGKRLSTSFDESAPNNTWSRNQQMVGYSFEHALNDTFTVRQNLRYAKIKTAQSSLYGKGICTASNCNGIATPELNHYLERGVFVDNERLNSFSVDTQLETVLNTGTVDHTLLTGIDYRRMRNDVRNLYATGTPLDLYNPVQEDFDFGNAEPYALNRTEQTGFYLQDQLEWEHWVATLGGRYDWSMQQRHLRAANTTTERNDHQFTWRAGLNYLFDNGITPYISYAQSFEPNDFSRSDTSPETYQPSRGEQYEAGVRYTPENQPIVLSAAVWQLTKTHNLTADKYDPLKTVAAGEIRSRGVELEAKAAITQSVNVTASWTYTDAEYTEDATLKGNTPYSIPRNMGSLWGDYTFNSGLLEGLTVGAGGRYIGSSYGDADNSFKVPSATLWNGMIAYELKQLGLKDASLALNVNNILNREYVASCFAEYACFWGAERQVVATATLRF